MSIHFRTVPVDLARQNVAQDDAEPLPPLVLIVDDDPMIAGTLSTILKGHGLAALTAEDGPAALEIASVIPPQMLLSDVVLRGMTGFELAAKFKSRIPDCEVILFSGEYSTCDVVSHHSDGHDFLTMVKPVHPADLLARVWERLSLHSWTPPDGLPERRQSGSTGV